MGGKAMPVIEIIPKTGWYDYKNKYQAGLTVEEILPGTYKKKGHRQSPAPCRARERSAYGRCILPRGLPMDNASGEIYCLEANTLPGMT